MLRLSWPLRSQAAIDSATLFRRPESRQMDLSPPLFHVCAVIISLLGTARCSNVDKTNCPCPVIPRGPPLTEPPQKSCFQINSTFRFKCVEGYVRQAGTSNLITCKHVDGDSKWFPYPEPSLKCKPDPRRTITQPPKTTVTMGPTDIPHDSIITTTVTANTSLQMTQNIRPSASETQSSAPASAGVPALSNHSRDFMTEAKATSRATSTSSTAKPSNSSTVPSHASPSALGSVSTVAGVGASVAIICALITFSILCYRRRSKNSVPPHTVEEQVPMHHVAWQAS